MKNTRSLVVDVLMWIPIHGRDIAVRDIPDVGTNIYIGGNNPFIGRIQTVGIGRVRHVQNVIIKILV